MIVFNILIIQKILSKNTQLIQIATILFAVMKFVRVHSRLSIYKHTRCIQEGLRELSRQEDQLFSSDIWIVAFLLFVSKKKMRKNSLKIHPVGPRYFYACLARDFATFFSVSLFSAVEGSVDICLVNSIQLQPILL